MLNRYFFVCMDWNHINVCFWYAFTRQVFQNHARRHIWKRSRPCSARWHITRRLSCCAKMLTAWNPCWICEAVFSVCCMVLAHVSSLTSRVQRRQDLLGWSLAYWWIEWRIHYINWTPNERNPALDWGFVLLDLVLDLVGTVFTIWLYRIIPFPDLDIVKPENPGEPRVKP